MKVAVACDHGGFPLKEAVLEAIQEAGHEALDLGIYAPESVDFPDYAKKAGKALQAGKANRANLMCGSGVGVCIAANKLTGCYSAICHDTYSAHQGVEHDQMNALCLGGRIVGTELAKDIVKAFLSAQPLETERHVRRFNKIKAIESSN